ncbi:hypothetical protein COP1_023996 [Malus domestica]
MRSDDIGEEEVDDVRESDRKPRTKDDKENVEREGERSRSRSDRHWDGQVDSLVKKSDEDDLFMKEKKPTEELEDKQKKLDEEMERRRRRVQQWLEFIRKKKEAEGEKHWEVDVDEPNSDGEAYRTDKEDGAVLEVDSENETAAPALQDDEIDPLDAFIILRIIPGEDSDSDYGDIENNDNPLEDEDDDEFTKRVTNKKVEKLCLVDHSKIDYEPFRKNFYIDVKEISKMTPEDVGAYRKQLEVKIHGKDVPKPI